MHDQADADRQRHERISTLLAAARHVPSLERGAWLMRECGSDDALRERAAELLRHAELAEVDGTDRLHERLAATVEAALDRDELADLPERIGRYRVIRSLGRGGMGVVLEAEQDIPRRSVALKILRPGSESREVMRRFEREAEVLGQLEHPGIAKVYDAGIARASDGRRLAFIAMELVRGKPATEHVRERGLGITERLELLAATCDAVQHAHARGFIHRDLKPANILVQEDGQPKVLDFGIARASGSDLKAVTVSTAVGEIIGTLPYMSPEQASGDVAALDVRADVHALGVLGFELLADRLPLDLDGLSLPHAVRVVREVEPPRLGTLDGRLRGNIETIVAKALAKVPSKRYQSAGEMADDIRRHLRREPILARPPGTTEQLARLARRHRTVVAAAGIALVAAIVGGVLLELARRREGVQRRAAEESAARAMQAVEATSRQSYRASIAAGIAALESDDVASARRHLEAAPEALRGWEWRHAWSRLDDSIATFAAPLEPDRSLIAWPDATTIGSVERSPAGRRLRAWDADSGRVVADVVVPRGSFPLLPVSCRAFALGALSVLPGQDEIVLAFDDGPAARRVRLPAHDALVELLPQRRRPGLGIVSAPGLEGWVDMSSGRSLVRPGRQAACAAVDASGTRLLSDIADTGLARIEELETLAPIATLKGHSQAVQELAWLPGDREVLTGSSDGSLRRWDASSGRSLETIDVGGPVTALAVTERVWLVGLRDGSIRVVDAATREPIATLHGATSHVFSIAPSPDGLRFASREEAGAVRTWPALARDPRLLARHASYAYDVQAIPGGHVAVTVSWDGELRFVDVRDGALLGVRRRGASTWWNSVVASADGRFVAAAGQDVPGDEGAVLVLDAVTGETLASLRGCDDVVTVAGGHLVAAGVGPTLHSWRVADWTEVSSRDLASLGQPASGFRPTVAGHPSLSLVAVGLPTGQVTIVDAASLAPRVTSEGNGRVTAFAWTSDGARLAVGLWDGTVRIADGATLRPTGAEARLQVGVHDLALSPDERRLAVSLDNGSVHVLEWPSLVELAVLHAHAVYVRRLAWLPDGSGLLTASGDATVRSWTTWPLREQVLWQERLAARRTELEAIVRAVRERTSSWSACADAIRAGEATTSEDDRELALEVVTLLASR